MQIPPHPLYIPNFPPLKKTRIVSKFCPRKQPYSPVFVLFFECPLREVDVTFEPRKTEVEFAHPEKVSAFLQASLKLRLH